MRKEALIWAFLLGMFFTITWMGYAKSHSFYDPWCCNEADCGPVLSVDQQVDNSGGPPSVYVTTKKGRALIHSETRILQSQDDEPHACILPGSRLVRCYYGKGGF